MCEASDPSDNEMSDKQDKDTDFNVDDYCLEIDNDSHDDSFTELPENYVNVCLSTLKCL